MYPLASGFGAAYRRSPLPQVARQKSLREGERSEFTDAKERVKASWAADREDFARVKESLKKKNAEHHLQCGRLSQVRLLAQCARCAPLPACSTRSVGAWSTGMECSASGTRSSR